MDMRTIRRIVLEGLEAGAVAKASQVDFHGAFLDGTIDIRLADLEMDSLAKMEICIAIEVGTGVSLAPEELDRYATLAALVEAIEERSRA
jgi:acyl carrier protein